MSPYAVHIFYSIILLDEVAQIAGAAHLSMTDRTYQAIKDRIVTLQLRPGQRVTEDQLVDLLGGGTSKTPVRDAVRWLVREGFIHKMGRGYRVAPITIRETRDLFAFRVILETAAVTRVLARRADVEQLVAFQSRAASAYNPADAESIRKFLCDSDGFHMAMAVASDSASLANTLSLVLEKLQPVLQLMLRTVPPDRLAVCEHNGLAAAISGRVPDEAVAAVEEHLRVSEQFVLEVLINLGGEVQLPSGISTHDTASRSDGRP